MKYLITGKNGQLAKEFIRRLQQDSQEVAAPEERDLDITNSRIVADTVRSFRPDVILNCAAYNAVDKAEQDPAAAFRVNADGPRNLARAASGVQARFVHFSSDYVFDGLKENGLYTEQDAVHPLNEYGKSKLAGERAAVEECGRATVFRLSWVFGPGKQNFIYKLGEWAKTNDYLKVSCDEFSVPTSTRDVVAVTMRALSQGMTGCFHLTNSGYCSRYEWAKLVLAGLAINKFIRPMPMDSFNLPAPRPKFSAMSNRTISTALGMTIPSWEEAVATYLREGGLTSE
ncbi:MAG TPA: dTDP-4-dehydrorhamnose reductase [Nitrospirota bacterium]|nr:dTDP-4-dehydrorhamnose reductase [Nitrospirota bacterium]